jgi:hypothetical protein
VTPGIVTDWLSSRHSRTSVAQAFTKPELERRVSSQTIPAEMTGSAVGCFECHGQKAAEHKDSFEHFGARIHVVVSPKDCQTCHAAEAGQFDGSKKSWASANLRENPVFHSLVDAVSGLKSLQDGKLVGHPASAASEAETCYACHGTEVKVKGMKTVSTAMGDIEVPALAGWPNQGVGRINPDGSRGSCAACHPRHSFAIEVARKPHTCAQCHLEPDVPAWNVYEESKHGNIALSQDQGWDWNAVPWKVGQDFHAPTCAACHNSLLVTPEGETVAPRSHDFGARLWVRLFGLPYSHPQPKSGATYLIRNKDGLPLPTALSGEPATTYLIDQAEQVRRREEMTGICRSCHSSTWAAGHFAKLDATVAEADRMTAASTAVMQRAWDAGFADRGNLFDEPLEMKWVAQWLFHANTLRYASAMGGPDYAAFKSGWWEMTRNLKEMQESTSGPKPTPKRAP